MEVLHSIWLFIQNQILGMKWLNEVIGSGLSSLGIDTTSRWGGSIQFFIYDVIKIMVLLGVLIFIISYIQSYFPPERTKRILGRFHGIGANCVAALLGTVTPFCSCSSILSISSFVDKSFIAPWCYILFPDFLSHGGFGKSGATYEHLRLEGCSCLCGTWSGDCRCRRYYDRKAASGKRSGRIYPQG